MTLSPGIETGPQASAVKTAPSLLHPCSIPGESMHVYLQAGNDMFFIFVYMLIRVCKPRNKSYFILLLFQNYFRDYWNIFDFIVVLGGLLDVIVTVVVQLSKTVSKGARGGESVSCQCPKEKIVGRVNSQQSCGLNILTFKSDFRLLPNFQCSLV